MRWALAAVVVVACLSPAAAWRALFPVDNRDDCDRLSDPMWPFAYAKEDEHVEELKGRFASSQQDFGHTCATRGARSLCNVCEDVQCESDTGFRVCPLQLQGAIEGNLHANIPTSTDVPFALGPNVTHRYDYGASELVCLWLEGGDCLKATTSDFSECAVRCWGDGFPPPVQDEFGWSYSKDVGQPQGRLTTFAGVPGEAGHRDGSATVALFQRPQGAAIDLERNLYVADTDNHVIRKVTPTGDTTTLAGVPQDSGEVDGPAATAKFSLPVGVTLFYDNSTEGGGRLTLFVADTNNHLIRRIREEPAAGSDDWYVETWAGGGTARADGIGPAGLQDGFRIEARFWTPRGVAVDADGHLFVADTNNHVIRYIDPVGNVSILAGTVRDLRDATANRVPEDAGCPEPCIEGVQGFDDGTRLTATFTYPTDVSVGENNTVLVSDGHRIRRITRFDRPFSTIQGINSFDRVVTLAGNLPAGDKDGTGQEATFDSPRGIMQTPDRHIYIADPVHCRIRRITPAALVAQDVQCSTRLVDVLRPSGCTSYDPAVDVLDFKATDINYNIHYSANTTAFDGFRIQRCLGSPPEDTSISSLGVLVSDGSMADAQTGATTVTHKEQQDEGTTYRLECPPGCLAAYNNTVFGTSTYADVSTLCAAAIHAGVIDDAGGLFSITITTSWGPSAGPHSPGSNRTLEGTTAVFHPNTTAEFNITSLPAPAAVRTFAVFPYPESLVEVHTVAGRPSAGLEETCGHADGQPALEGKLSLPSAVATFPPATLTDTEFLYIADTNNHVIRTMTATCSQVCENGGVCTAPETCTCTPGWSGFDCTLPVCNATCPPNSFCTGRNRCTCKPGYTGSDCQTPLCVQECFNGGSCSRPDTCACTPGWYGVDCSIPICLRTCGNGGNCTAPATCTCPSEWGGQTCRVPQCNNVQCLNGGTCIAPDTCYCPPGWSGHDCSKPVCTQGFFRADAVPEFQAPRVDAGAGVTLPPLDGGGSPSLRPLFWSQYLPCEIREWCNSTNEFDCFQAQRTFTGAAYDGLRTVTGFHSWGSPDDGACFALELDLLINYGLRTPYRLEEGDDGITAYVRYTDGFVYPANSTTLDENGTAVALPWAAPFAALPDRQIPLVQYLNVSQGVFVCANGGECVGPDTCLCKPGWSGYDCRTPVCRHGWYDDDRTPVDPVSGASPRYLHQGSYRCSTRAVTLWENPATPGGKFPGYVHGHPVFSTQHSDPSKGWPPTHVRVPAPGNDTREGWRRDGYWNRTEYEWEFGVCPDEFARRCPSPGALALNKTTDLRTGLVGGIVDDPEAAFGARVNYSDARVEAVGWWLEDGGECVDDVINGCFNNGTCVAPGTCECSPGWEGHDCSLPVCQFSVLDVVNDVEHPATLLRADGVNVGNETGSLLAPALPNDTHVQYRECLNRGNCTHPDTCTCEKGWSGPDCSIPLCAQECFNGGTCVAPDTCECVVWWNTFRDGRGRPVYRKSNNDPQITGWTGYDCNTPICTQAERFILNRSPPTAFLVNSTNAGTTFQAGCPPVTRYTPPDRTRTSLTHLCGNLIWYEGVYNQTWANNPEGFPEPVSISSEGRVIRQNHENYVQLSTEVWVAAPEVAGEGLYGCQHKGSCVSPDVCECNDGWGGFDCSTPSCRHVNAFGEVTGCLNGGVCGFRDDCTCIQEPSILWTVHADEPEVDTGYMGTDCSIPMCVQGFFDPTCTGVGPSSSGGEGCYRCDNGGNCTAPDFCTCPPEWTGWDCNTPVCTQHADFITATALDTVDPLKITQFELDPCGSELVEEHQGVYIGRGNCTSPDTCTCLCTKLGWRNEDGELVEKPWSDPLGRSLPAGVIYGRFDCIAGYEGNLNFDGTFSSCHLEIFVPSWLVRNSLLLLIIGSVALFFFLLLYIFVRRKLRQRYLLAKAERRRSRRSSEEEAMANK